MVDFVGFTPGFSTTMHQRWDPESRTWIPEPLDMGAAGGLGIRAVGVTPAGQIQVQMPDGSMQVWSVEQADYLLRLQEQNFRQDYLNRQLQIQRQGQGAGLGLGASNLPGGGQFLMAQQQSQQLGLQQQQQFQQEDAFRRAQLAQQASLASQQFSWQQQAAQLQAAVAREQLAQQTAYQQALVAQQQQQIDMARQAQAAALEQERQRIMANPRNLVQSLLMLGMDEQQVATVLGRSPWVQAITSGQPVPAGGSALSFGGFGAPQQIVQGG